MASARARGMVAAVVLPNRSMLITILSGDKPNRSAALRMIRRFAWCETNRSTSSAPIPFCRRTRRQISSCLSHRKLEDRRAVLMNEVLSLVDRLVAGWMQAATSRHTQRGPTAPVDFVSKIDNPEPFVGSWRHDRSAGPIAEQDAGSTILVVDDRGHHVGSDHQGVLMRPGRHHLRGRGQGIGEPRAGRTQIESPGVRCPDLGLNEAGGAGEEHVGSRRRHDDEPDVVGGQPSL